MEELESLNQRREDRARSFEQYFAGSVESLIDQFAAPSLLDAVGIQSGQTQARERAMTRLKEDVERQRQEVRDDARLNARQQAEELLEITREFEREKRDIERQYEQERSDAWKDWVRQQLIDFPKLIFQQLNLQLAARTTNFILNSLGIGGRVPITGPGVGQLLAQGVQQYTAPIGPRLNNNSGAIGPLLGAFSGGGAGAVGGAGGFVRPELSGYGGGGGTGFGASLAGAGARLGATGSNLATGAAATGFALAAHNIITGAIPAFNAHNQSLYSDFGGDIAKATGLASVTTFFDNLIFHNARNDAMANAAGKHARIQQAARLGRESARDIVSNFSEGFNESAINPQEKMYVVPANTTFSMPIIIGDQETRQISYTIDQLMSEGRI